MTGMIDDLEKKLAEAAEAVREHDVHALRRSALAERMAAVQAEIDSLCTRVAEEEYDVERLEGLSLTRILAALRGSRDDDLAFERAQADAARYRLAEARAKLAALRAEDGDARSRLAALSSAPAIHAGLLQEKERRLAASPTPSGRRLLEIAEQRGVLDAELRELAEATRAATAADEALAAVRASLSSAKSWSTYDTFFGGGAISSAVKHSRLDDAAAAAASADRCLAVLRTELADVNEVRLPAMTVDGGTRFVDTWFDNIFTDMRVRDQIRDSLAGVERCAGAVHRIRRELEQRTHTARERRAALEAERRRIVLG
jgi:hypothetical protein